MTEIDFMPCAKRVRVQFNGEVVADTTAVRLLREPGYTPVYYFPQDDVRRDLLAPSDHTSRCPRKGEATYWTVAVGDRQAVRAAWGYPGRYEGYLAFDWNAMDQWYEEDEEVFVHARDPFARIDVLESRREVTVQLGGETLARSRRALFLFETALPVRYYLPQEDVRMDLLEASDSHTACPYKGTASYYSVRVGGRRFEDAVWTYPDPLPECGRIKDRLCFYNERVDTILIDGEVQAKPRTKWSQER